MSNSKVGWSFIDRRGCRKKSRQTEWSDPLQWQGDMDLRDTSNLLGVLGFGIILEIQWGSLRLPVMKFSRSVIEDYLDCCSGIWSTDSCLNALCADQLGSMIIPLLKKASQAWPSKGDDGETRLPVCWPSWTMFACSPANMLCRPQCEKPETHSLDFQLTLVAYSLQCLLDGAHGLSTCITRNMHPGFLDATHSKLMLFWAYWTAYCQKCRLVVD